MKTLLKIAILIVTLILLVVSLQLNCSEIVGPAWDSIEEKSDRKGIKS